MTVRSVEIFMIPNLDVLISEVKKPDAGDTML